MKVLHSLDDARTLAGVALALGNFDGVHLGHRALFKEAAEHGRPGALTFEPHPGKVLQPELAPRLITPLPRKLQLLEGAGLDVVVVLPFTVAFARTPARDFEGMLFDRARVRAVVVGRDYTYGAQRAGTVSTLTGAAMARGAVVAVVDPVTVNGVVASSSRIREYILEGRVGAARALLGRPFDLDGVVVKGDGRGRSIGFPTANVDTHGELLPASGVYSVRARTGERWHGRGGQHRDQADLRGVGGDGGGAPARLVGRPVRTGSAGGVPGAAARRTAVRLGLRAHRANPAGRGGGTGGACTHLGGSLTPFFPTS